MRLSFSFARLGALALAASLAACEFSASTAGIADAKLAKGYDSAKTEASDPTTTFSTSDKVIHCVVKLNSAPEHTKLRADWKVVKVENMEPEKLLIASDLDAGGKINVADFTLTAANGLPVGDYKCDVYLNPKSDGSSKPEKSLPFTVK